MSLLLQRMTLECLGQSRFKGRLRTELAKQLGTDANKFHYVIKVKPYPCCYILQVVAQALPPQALCSIQINLSSTGSLQICGRSAATKSHLQGFVGHQHSFFAVGE